MVCAQLTMAAPLVGQPSGLKRAAAKQTRSRAARGSLRCAATLAAPPSGELAGTISSLVEMHAPAAATPATLPAANPCALVHCCSPQDVPV